MLIYLASVKNPSECLKMICWVKILNFAAIQVPWKSTFVAIVLAWLLGCFCKPPSERKDISLDEKRKWGRRRIVTKALLIE